MEKENCIEETGKYIRVISKIIKKLEMVNFKQLMEFTKDISKMVYLVDKVDLYGKIKIYMKEHLNKEKWMEKEFLHFQVDKRLREFGKWGKIQNLPN